LSKSKISAYINLGMPKHLEETVVDIESVFAVINEQFDNLWPFVGVSCLLAQSFLFS